jgi:hypothetical protein
MSPLYYVNLGDYSYYKDRNIVGKMAFTTKARADEYREWIELKEKKGTKEQDYGMNTDDARAYVHLDQEYLYDNRVNDLYDPFRIDPDTIHWY